ncbi:MAG: pentapeptide repeat-containing protein [Vibrio sp.]
MKSFKSNEQYFDVCFSQCESSQDDFENIEFEECDFCDCDLSNSAFKNCKFINCQFKRCNLSLVSFSNTHLFGVRFLDSKLVGIDWTKATWAVYHLDFELNFQRCIMNDVSFFGLTMNELVLDECKLHDADFREGNFSDSKMTFCDFTNSLFMRTNLQNVDFTESINYSINVLENQVKGAKFSRYEALNLLGSLGIELCD